MKKFLSLILALTMAASLAACGSGQTPSASQETDEPSSSAVEPSNPDSSQTDALDALRMQIPKENRWWSIFLCRKQMIPTI